MIRQQFHLNKGYLSSYCSTTGGVGAVHVSTAKFIQLLSLSIYRRRLIFAKTHGPQNTCHTDLKNYMSQSHYHKRNHQPSKDCCHDGKFHTNSDSFSCQIRADQLNMVAICSRHHCYNRLSLRCCIRVFENRTGSMLSGLL